jgi:hypothetical protein
VDYNPSRVKVGGALSLEALSAGKVGWEMGDGTGADFLLPAAPSQYDLPGKFPIFRKDSQFKFYLQEFRYTNHMEQLATGRTVASYRGVVHFTGAERSERLAFVCGRAWG